MPQQPNSNKPSQESSRDGSGPEGFDREGPSEPPNGEASNGKEPSRDEDAGNEPGFIGPFISQYGKKQTSRAYRTDLEKFEAFLDENRASATLEDASRQDVLQFLWAETQSVGRSTLRRRATALKSFFEWLEGEGQRAGRPIGEDENASELVDSVLEKGPPSEEDRSSFEQRRQDYPEGQTEEKKTTGDEEPTKGESPTGGTPTGGKDPTAGESSPGEDENTDPDNGSSPNERGASGSGDQASQEEEESTSREETYTPTEGPLDIPHWVFDAAEEKADDPPLRAGPHIPLVEVPGALRHGLGELSERTGSRFGPDYIRITCEGGDLVVKIQFREDSSRAERARIEAQIEHRLLERIVEHGPDSLRSHHSVPEQALRYFWGRSWSMPPVVYELVDFSHAGGQSDKRPTWTSFSPDSTQARCQAAIEVTGALAKAFGLAKDEEVLVRLGP